MTPQELYDMLRRTQEPQGYFFNQDRARVMELMEALLLNKERYGYMGCPCRLCCDDRERDADIICPCAYREADVAEYGSCYCNLYVSRQWNQGEIEHRYVPERRPADRAML